MTAPMIHPLSDVQATHIGAGTRVWQFCVVLAQAQIGANCNVCSHCLIENDVQIGDRVTVKSGVQLWDGLRVGDDVFIGPNVSFTNDKKPRSRQWPEAFAQTVVEQGASIGAGAVILPGITIGTQAMVGAGAVVTRSVPPKAIVVGNPARIVGYVGTHRENVTVQVQPAPSTAGTSLVRGVRLVQLPKVTDIRGSLSVAEFEQHVPFAVRRAFMVFDVPSVETRGEHAHHVCHQFLICVRGRVTAVADDGTQREQFVLDRPDIGLYMPPMIWGTQYQYSPDAVLLVFASHAYDAGDYIRRYEDFVRIAGGGKA